MDLSEVSKTAVITLRSRAIESKKRNPLISDPMAELLVERLCSMATDAERRELFGGRLPPALTNHISLRARKYDAIAKDFISRRSPCTVVSLGAGFDTRRWRIPKCRYVELDLPEVVRLKRKLLGKKLDYELIGQSVLDTSWMKKASKGPGKDFLFIAEGLFVYLPKDDVRRVIREVSERFTKSEMALEVADERYTRGIWKRIVDMKFRELGSGAGSYGFGIKNARELESYGRGIKVVGEWSYLEDPDVRPRLLGLLRGLGFLTRSQWTVTLSMGS